MLKKVEEFHNLCNGNVGARDCYMMRFLEQFQALTGKAKLEIARFILEKCKVDNPKS